MSSREEAVFRIIDLVRRNQVLTQMLDEAAAGHIGVNPIDARAVDVIDQHGRITAGDLARELRLSTGAVTALVDRLERAGCARRVSDPDDRRRVLIEVTQVVHRLSEQIYGTPDDAVSFAEAFTDEELEVVRRYEELTTRWLEGRLAYIERLKPRPGKKRLSGRGRA